MNDTYRIHLQGFPAPLRVVRQRVVEALSEPYRLSVRVIVPEAAALAPRLLGSAATCVTAIHGGHERRWQGLVSSARASRAGAAGAALDLRIEPRAARLRLRSRRRIFQDMDAVAIALAILDEHDAPARSQVRRDLPRRPYTVQLDETDLEFVDRLLADVGVFYRFAQPSVDTPAEGAAPAETIVLCDGPSSYDRAAWRRELTHRDDAPPEGRRAPDGIHAVRFVTRIAIDGVTSTTHDFKRPAAPTTTTASATPSSFGGRARLDRSVSDFTGESLEPDPAFVANALEAARRGVDHLTARTEARHLEAGAVFTLTESLHPELCGEWVVVRWEHRGRDAVAGGTDIGASDGRLSAIPAARCWRPARIPKPHCRGVETATVTGPEREAVHTDAHGRVRVRFPWDLSGTKPEHASTWLRVTQPWAGAGYGAQFLPRVGSEVLVGFVGGDPDRPIVLGGLYDGRKTYPTSLPESRTASGFRTSSVGGPGSSELFFEDAAGQELVSLRGARNVWIGAGADLVEQITGKADKRIGGQYVRQVGGDVEEIVGGSRHVTVTGNHVERTGGAAIVRVGNQLLDVTGGRFESTTGSMEVRVTKSHHLIVGTGASGFSNHTVQGTCTTSSSGRLTLASTTDIVLEVGDSKLVISPDGITLSAPIVKIASPSVLLHGKDGEEYVELGEGIRAKADVIELFAEKANLLLGEKARLEGAKVELASHAASADAVDVSDESETAVVTFEIKSLEAGKAATALVLMPNGEVVEHPVPSSGVLQIEGKRGERFSLIDVRVGGASVAKSHA